jgi:hypothetical protein
MGELDNLTISGTGNNSVLTLNNSESPFNEWTKLAPLTSPTQRTNTRMASAYGTDKMVLFGGYSGSNLNDTWIYDLNNATWLRKYPSSDPGARNDHTMVTMYGYEKVLLFGGIMGNYDDETWVYHVSNNSWTQQNPLTKPASRDDHAMASIWGDDKAVIFGGDAGGVPFSDTWVYDLSNNTWARQWPSPKPLGRNFPGMAGVYGTDSVVLFGGYNSFRRSDTWVYHLNNNTWIRKYPNPRPSARYGHNMATIPGTDCVLLFGGNDANGYDDETWIYSLGNNTWKQLFPTPKPDVRYDFAMASFSEINKILVFGGTGSVGNLNDTWEFNLRSYVNNGTFTSAPMDLNANSTFFNITWNSILTSNTYLKFQLKTGSDLSELDLNEFVGPDGNSTTFYTNSPGNIWSGHRGDKWIQLIAYMNTTNSSITPVLKSVTINYNCIPFGQLASPANGTISSINKPRFTWSYNDYDSIEQYAFQVLIDNNSDFESIDYNSEKQNTTELFWQFPNGTGYFQITDGIWYWKLRVRDPDGAWGQYSEPGKFIIDTTYPVSSTTIPMNNGFYGNLNLISGQAYDGYLGSGINKVEINLNRLKDNHHWDGSDWKPFNSWLLTSGTNNWSYDSSSISWDSGFQYSIQSRSLDNATNLEIPVISNVFTIDTERPSSNIYYPTADSYIKEIANITGKAVDVGGAGINSVEIMLRRASDNRYWNGTDWIKTQTWISSNGTENWEFNCIKVNWTSNIRYIIRSRAKDNVGNLELPGTGISFVYDNEPPYPVTISINDNQEYTNNVGVTLSLTAEDLGSDASIMRFSMDNFTWSDWEPFNHTKSFTLPVVEDGVFSVYFSVQDHAGNIADTVFDTIILDSTPPIDLGISINKDSVYTNSEIIELNITATDHLSGLNEMCFSTDNTFWSTWETYSIIKSMILPIGDGEKDIFFKVNDKAGNYAESHGAIILDTNPPYSVTLNINDGASETNSTTVLLDIGAKDDLSGVDKLALSSDGKSWDAWENFSNLIEYLLPPGEGRKTIYLRVIDGAGNIANPVSSSILLIDPIPDDGPGNGNDSNNDKPNGSGDGEGTGDFFANSIMWILLVVIIIIIIAVFVIFKKEKKQTTDQITPSGAVTIKPRADSTQVITLEHGTQTPGPQQVAVPGTYQAGYPQPVVASSTSYIEPQVTVPPTMVQSGYISQMPPAQPQPQPQAQLPTHDQTYPSSQGSEIDISLPESITGPPPSKRYDGLEANDIDLPETGLESKKVETMASVQAQKPAPKIETPTKQYIIQRQQYLPPVKDGAKDPFDESEISILSEPETEPIDIEVEPEEMPATLIEPELEELAEEVPDKELDENGALKDIADGNSWGDSELEEIFKETSELISDKSEKQDLLERLERLGKLKALGILSEEEFKKAKKELLE